MKIAMLAPPWLPIPPQGYGGIENVLDILVPALIEQGVEVELFTVGESTIQSSKNHSLYETGQYEYIHESIYSALPIVIAQSLFALNIVQQAGDFDLIHSHNGFIDPGLGLYSDGNLPPMLHTLHGPPFERADRHKLHLPDTQPLWREIGRASSKNFYIVGISESLMKGAPPELLHRFLSPVHNGIDTKLFRFRRIKHDYFMTLGRAHPDKGQALAVQACLKLDVPLKLAGLVGDMRDARKVILELANPLSRYRSMLDFRYFSDTIFPYLEPGKIDYLGDVAGERKLRLLAGARALLFPIQWDEPFGMVAIEALACGTPVIALARGALPEIIEHGVNGFLANTMDEFEHYMKRVGEIDPAACRKSVEDKFSAKHMAAQYIARYKQILEQ